MALVVIELETLVSEPDALTTRPPPCCVSIFCFGILLWMLVHVWTFKSEISDKAFLKSLILVSFVLLSLVKF